MCVGPLYCASKKQVYKSFLVFNNIYEFPPESLHVMWRHEASIRYMYRYILLYNNTISPNNVIANVYFELKQGEAVSRRHNIYLTD